MDSARKRGTLPGVPELPRLQRRRIWGKHAPTAEDGLGAHPPSGPPALLTLEQPEAFDMYKARPTRDIQRTSSVPAWMYASSRALPDTLTRALKYKRGCQRHKCLNDQEQQDVFEGLMR